MDDNERRLWVLNDEGLYNWWKSTGVGVYRFVRENRKELTKIINRKMK